jgi:phosphoglycolate phosphatase
MFHLAVFDLDGTLIDSRRDLADATNAMLADFGASALPVDTVAAMVGEGASLLVRRALTASTLDPETPGALARFLERYDERLVAHTTLYDGMRATLEALAARLRMAVLTNKPQRATDGILDALGIRQTFFGVIGGDTAFGRKPDPAGLRDLMRTAGASPEETVLVGDSAVDLATARNAEVRACLARYGFGFRGEMDLRGDELLADAPADLLALLLK